MLILPLQRLLKKKKIRLQKDFLVFSLFFCFILIILKKLLCNNVGKIHKIHNSKFLLLINRKYRFYCLLSWRCKKFLQKRFHLPSKTKNTDTSIKKCPSLARGNEYSSKLPLKNLQFFLSLQTDQFFISKLISSYG